MKIFFESDESIQASLEFVTESQETKSVDIHNEIMENETWEQLFNTLVY